MWLLWTYIHMQKNNFATKTFLELLEFQGSSNLISQDKVRGIPELIITKQKHLINSLVPRMSSPSIMSRYMFNIACYLSIEVWKVLKSDWFRKLLATCKTSEKSNIFPMQLFTARQENKEITEQTEKGHFTEQHHTTHRSNKISTCWLLLKRLFWPKSWNQYLPPDFFGKIPKHLDVHFNSSPEFKAYIYKLSKSIVMSF